ncbi:hypothetical protein COP2_009951 [Malus domestica]
MKAELTQDEVVYSPKTLQVWRHLLNWLGFFFQIFLQILRALGHHLILSFSSSSSTHSAAFKSLPVIELPDNDSPAASAVVIANTPDFDSYSDDPFEKLTVVLYLDETLVCAYETSILLAIVRTQVTEVGMKWFELECVSLDKEYDGKPKVTYVIVFEYTAEESHTRAHGGGVLEDVIWVHGIEPDRPHGDRQKISVTVGGG